VKADPTKSSPQLLTGLLRDVSRSFYLTLRILPGAIRPSIGLAYLLARATDTIADTELVPVNRRLTALQTLRDQIAQPAPFPPEFDDLAQHQGLPAERLLLARIGEALQWLQRLDPPARQRIQEVLAVITSGQELDLRRFGEATADGLRALATDAELNDYTYRVAGCVGEFWTRICFDHLPARADLDPDRLLPKAVRFGQGLQLVNILRDLPADLRKGRCYLPETALANTGLLPAELLDPKNESRLRPLYRGYLRQARTNLAAGWEYTNALPRNWMRVRLACAWPILIGVRTLDRLATGAVLDPTQRLKVSRSEVRRIILRSIFCYPWPFAWRRLFPASGLDR
jgi:farnesyl-diphosphate farnesyltransferase